MRNRNWNTYVRRSYRKHWVEEKHTNYHTRQNAFLHKPRLRTKEWYKRYGLKMNYISRSTERNSAFNLERSKPTNDCWQTLHESFSQYYQGLTDQSLSTDQSYNIIDHHWPSTDKHYSLDSEDGFHKGYQNVSQQLRYEDPYVGSRPISYRVHLYRARGRNETWDEVDLNCGNGDVIIAVVIAI